MSSVSKPPAIYLAAPLFNESERRFNLDLSELLTIYAAVFLPQRDGELLCDLVRRGVPVPVARQTVFEADTNAIRQCDCLVAVLDGRTIDEGVAFEIGYAHALGKLCLGIKTDDRSLLTSGDNPMISGGCHAIYRNRIELTAAIKRLFSQAHCQSETPSITG